MAETVTFKKVPSCVPWDLATNEQVTGGPALRILRNAGILQAGKYLTNKRILDIGCGAGVVTSLLRQASDQPQIVAADISEKMVAAVKERVEAEGWSGIEVEQVDMEAMDKFPDGGFDYVFGNMAFGFSPNVTKALQETHRVLKPGGVIGFTTWPYISWWPIAQAALRTYLPDAPFLSEPMTRSASSFGKTIGGLKADVQRIGFEDVVVERHDFTVDDDSTQWARAAAILITMVGKRAWSAEEFEKFAPEVENAMKRYVVEDLGYTDRFTKEMSAFVTIAKKK